MQAKHSQTESSDMRPQGIHAAFKALREHMEQQVELMSHFVGQLPSSGSPLSAQSLSDLLEISVSYQQLVKVQDE